MKKIVLFLSLCWMSFDGFSQVGINTTSPDAQLEIRSTNQAAPTNTDGVLIPKIDAFPATNPTAAQQGMMVYLTTISAGKAPGFYYWDNTGTPQWRGIGASNGWDVTGNAGTTPATNFVGTTDNNDLAFRRFNLPSGKIGQFSTSIGVNSMTVNTAGNNTAFGNQTLPANTIGNSNTAIGTTALFANTIGNSNLAIGYGAMNNSTTASYNTAIGNNSLFVQSFSNGGAIYATNNTAVGESALFSNNPNSATTGKDNTALGFNALYGNTTGSNNIGIGANATVPSPAANNQMSIGNVIYGADMSTTALAKIGIGVSVPAEKLEVAGKTKTTDLQVTNGAGIGKILTSDATGNGLWQTTNTALNSFSWLTTGNTGTNPATNFIGTIDDIDLKFRRYNTNAGTVALTNTALGLNSLNPLGTGTANNAFGANTLKNNTTGTQNTAVGNGAMEFNTTGNYNTAIGTNAMHTNKAGSNGVAIGNRAMYYGNDTTVAFDNHNVAIGYQALEGSTTPANNTGDYNTAVGYQTLLKNTSGSFNSALGEEALTENTTGVSNLAFGYYALNKNTIGGSNTAIGALSLQKNVDGNHNVGVGMLSLEYNESGSRNTAIGRDAAGGNTTGDDNVAIGNFALLTNRAGSKAIAIGSGAMQNSNNTTTAFENKNIAIGFEALKGDISSAVNTGVNNIAIGSDALKATTSGEKNIALGNSALAQNTLGIDNIGIGIYNLQQNTNGRSNTSLGNYALEYGNASNNTAVGYYALNHIGGNNNTAVGHLAMAGTTMGPGNTSLGAYSLQNVTGTYNTATGYMAGDANTSGNYNISIGANSDVLNPAADYQMSIGNVFYGDGMANIGTARFSIGDLPSASYKFYVYNQQLTANADGQSTIFGYRTRDSQNDGTAYSRDGSNSAVKGHNNWGDKYSFGVSGFSYNDTGAGYNRSGGILGAVWDGVYWGSLGYRSSGPINYGVYATAVLATGAGRMSQPQNNTSIGGGFYGGIIGSWSKGNIIGQMSSGNLFAAYNSGDEYTTGKQIELVDTGNQKTAAYTVTSTESIVYKKGKATLTNGTARVDFDKNYSALLGEIPVVTTTPMGQCNGLYIESIDQNGFTIKELNNGSSDVTVSWIAVGDRIDAQQTKLPKALLEKAFDNNINEVMFNENNKTENAKAIWFDGTNIQIGQLPAEFIEKSTDKKE